MDIVRRAYDKVHGVPVEGDPVLDEVKRLIQVRAYATRDWPREWGPLPEDLRAKRKPPERR